MAPIKRTTLGLIILKTRDVKLPLRCKWYILSCEM